MSAKTIHYQDLKISPLIILILTIIIGSLSTSLYSITLTFDIPNKERLELVKTARVKFLLNGILQNTYLERNIIDLTCVSKEENNSHVKGIFTVYESPLGETLFQMREQYPTDFYIKPNGEMLVPEVNAMPNLRNLPSFPTKDLKTGDEWDAPFDMVLTEYSQPLKLMLQAHYSLVSIDDRGIALLHYSFSINKDLTQKKYPADFPLRILGQDSGFIYWDTKRNVPIQIKENYQILFLYATSNHSLQSAEFIMELDSQNTLYKENNPADIEKAKNNLQKIIPENQGVHVTDDPRGLSLQLGDVLFDFNSAKLKKETEDKLLMIAEQLKKEYPDRELIIEGRTDNIGSADYNQQLSEERAENVARFLKNATGNDKLSFHGLGADNPTYKNDTPENRKKNRRVDIIIKLK